MAILNTVNLWLSPYHIMLLVAGTSLLVLVMLWSIPPALARRRLKMYAATSDIEPSDILQHEREARSFVIPLVTGLALVLSLTVAWLSFRDTNRKVNETRKYQTTEMYFKAIELLGIRETIKHVGGVYSLEYVATISGELAEPVARVLSAFVQSASPKDRKDGPCKKLGPSSPKDRIFLGKQVGTIGDDVQDGIRVIGRTVAMYKGPHPKLNLQGVDLSNSDLCYVYAKDVSFHDVYFGYSDLRNAIFDGADLSRANFIGADLRGIHVPKNVETGRRAILRGANLQEANIADAFLLETDFTKASFCKGNLSGVSFNDSRLNNSILNCADLRGADLSKAQGVSIGQLQMACTHSSTKLPAGLSVRADPDCIEKCKKMDCSNATLARTEEVPR